MPAPYTPRGPDKEVPVGVVWTKGQQLMTIWGGRTRHMIGAAQEDGRKRCQPMRTRL